MVAVRKQAVSGWHVCASHVCHKLHAACRMPHAGCVIPAALTFAKSQTKLLASLIYLHASLHSQPHGSAHVNVYRSLKAKCNIYGNASKWPPNWGSGGCQLSASIAADTAYCMLPGARQSHSNEHLGQLGAGAATYAYIYIYIYIWGR